MARTRTEAIDLGLTICEEILFEASDRRERLTRRRDRLQALRNGVRSAGLIGFLASVDSMISDVEREQVLLENEIDLLAALAIERYGWDHGEPEVMARAKAALSRVNDRLRQLRLGASQEPRLMVAAR